MIVIIDGDNSPGVNVRNLEKLDDKDRAIIYYAADNGFFAKETNRSQIVDNSRCEIDFKCIPAGNCAVDLAVAMDAPDLLRSFDDKVLVLVSKDKHFKTIQNLLKPFDQECYVAQSADVEEAVQNYKVLEAASLDDLQHWLVYLFGGSKGKELFARIDSLFAEKYADLYSVKKGRRPEKERLFSALLSDIISLCQNSK